MVWKEEYARKAPILKLKIGPFKTKRPQSLREVMQELKLENTIIKINI